MRHRLPFAMPGQVIGLLGGSFDPPHLGHVHISREAVKRFGLDRVWWLVTPGNPLKARRPAPMARRLAAARALIADDPRIVVSDLEVWLETRYTAEMIGQVQTRYPGVRFVWLMGADNLVQFHHWDRWRSILDRVPVGVMARPGDRIGARLSPAARAYAPARLKGERARLLGQSVAPAWVFVNIPMSPLSSTEFRAAGRWSSA